MRLLAWSEGVARVNQANNRVTEERVLEGKSIALTLLNGLRAFTAAADRFYLGTGYVCGTLFLLLALFITYQAIARKLDLIMAPAMDLWSGFVLGMAATWAFSYALRTGSHVRIDVLLPYMPPTLRKSADFFALAAIGFFASITAWKTWETQVLYSRNIGALHPSFPVEIWIPQAFVAVGFSLLGFTAIQMMVTILAEAILPRVHVLLGGTVSFKAGNETAEPAEETPSAI